MMRLELAAASVLRNWKVIVGGLVFGALVIALLLTRSTLADVKTERDKVNQALGAERTAHSISRQSVAVLEQVVAARVAEANLAAAEYERAKVQAAKDLADANARYASTEARRKTLERLASSQPVAPCPVPGDLTAALEGL